MRATMRVDLDPVALAGRRSSPPGARAAMAVFALLASCGSGGADLHVHGAAIVVDSAAPFTRQSDFSARLESTLGAALQYWGGTWADLDHARITFIDDAHVPCEGSPSAVGCYQGGEIRVSTRDAGVEFTCLEETVLVHEIGHAIIGDPDHTDPRWMDFGSLARALAGRRGYDSGGEAACNIFVNVWRHPPDLP